MSAIAELPGPAIVKTRPARLHSEVIVTETNGWRIMRSPRFGCHSTWRQMLAANSALPPRLKYALVPESWDVELRAECLSSEESLAGSCVRFMRGESPSLKEDEPPEHAPDADTLIHLCESAGWKAELRANKTVVVPLPSGVHIRIETSAGALRCVVELGEITMDEMPTTRARELLLLTLAHEMRMIRPLLRGRAAGTHTLAEIEAGFTRAPEAEELNHALAALGVAASACAEVFDALGDQDLASRYLAIRQPQQRPPV